MVMVMESRLTELLNLDPLTCDDGVLARAYQDLLALYEAEHERRVMAEAAKIGQLIGLEEMP